MTNADECSVFEVIDDMPFVDWRTTEIKSLRQNFVGSLMVHIPAFDKLAVARLKDIVEKRRKVMFRGRIYIPDICYSETLNGRYVVTAGFLAESFLD